MVIFRRDENPDFKARGKGTWSLIWRSADHAKGHSAIIVCPECGKDGSLLSHDINADGHISPSLVCPHNPCAFHDFGQLEGWTEAIKA